MLTLLQTKDNKSGQREVLIALAFSAGRGVNAKDVYASVLGIKYSR
ncbi:hypothetical protein PRUB_a0887 [Pseudoalteromonas rubra]|uniref:Uncharacterized protein n=1 Tax=Pseudoalteromonas rubra TaxID=43658 RepID=A0A8T0C8H3_9GAMM|nr:hypothetical protein PRUB_a0887 [Pseudoalteromonas rubra]